VQGLTLWIGYGGREMTSRNKVTEHEIKSLRTNRRVIDALFVTFLSYLPVFILYAKLFPSRAGLVILAMVYLVCMARMGHFVMHFKCPRCQKTFNMVDIWVQLRNSSVVYGGPMNKCQYCDLRYPRKDEPYASIGCTWIINQLEKHAHRIVLVVFLCAITAILHGYFNGN
jgi:hypothetical protein